jgi:hypothetical protein
MYLGDYDLTMNVEQDSQGNQEYVAALYTPAIGHHQGRGTHPHLAIIALAYKIMEWDQINARSTKIKVPRIDLAKALSQPAQKPLPEQRPSTGRIVHYYAMPGEFPGHNVERPLPAIVTKADGLTVNIQVFLDSNGTAFMPGVDYCEAMEPGTWSWPVK